MATNTGRGHRKGAVRGKTQFENPNTGIHYKRDSDSGRIVSGKKSGGKYKGVTKAHILREWFNYCYFHVSLMPGLAVRFG